MGERCRVLMYHAVGTRTAHEDPNNLFVPVECFERQLDLVASRGLVPVDLSSYFAGDVTSRSVLLTFDDAYESTLRDAAPRLSARGWPAVVFVASRTVGGRATWNPCPEQLLGLDGLVSLGDAGFEVGAHSRHHVDLRGLDPHQLAGEVAGSADDLEDLLGTRPRSFAYPFGHHDAAAREAVRAAGYDGGFAVHRGRGTHALTRVDVNSRDTPAVFAAKLHRAWPVAHRTISLVPPLRRAVHRLSSAPDR